MIEGFIQDIRNAISDHNVVIHAESDLVLELLETEDSLMHCGYYFVYHPERLIYWLEDVEIEYQCKMVSEVRGDLNGYQASEFPTTTTGLIFHSRAAPDYCRGMP